MKIYLAGPLFSDSERAWLAGMKRQMEYISPDITVIWPYDLIPRDHPEAHDRRKIFELCRSHLDEVDVLVCVLDGPQVDDGTAWEIGYFYSKYANRLPVIGIRTDFRSAGETEHSVVNAMIECSCSKIVHSSNELLTALAHLSLA
ncbi:conserved hypothetical protein [delta proteobacterium NaphS2]|nr:conserved hypothetical protein [delta proteobacterium NaphS2]